MDDPGLDAMFRSHFTADIVAACVRALRVAYDAVAERHDPDEGSNNETFGFTLYHFGVKRLKEAFGDRDLGVKCGKVNNAFRMFIGPYQIGCYKVGESEHDDIATSFPGNDGAAAELVESQLWLPGVPKTRGVERAKKVVIAHLGNPDDGFRALYLCVAGKMRGERICEWAYTMLLWRADAAVLLPPAPALPVEETIAPPTVALKDRQVPKDASADRSPANVEPPQVEEVPPPAVTLASDEGEDEGHR